VLRDLFLIPHQWMGLPLFGFGWLLIAWAVGSVGLLVWLWRHPRRGTAGEVLSYVPVLLVFGAVIAFVMPLLEKNFPDGGLPIRGYGVMLLIAVVAGVSLAARQAARMGLNPDIIYSFAFWVFVAGIVGARAFFVIQYWEQFPRETTLATIGAILNVTEGGLVVYGSLIGAMLAGVVFLYVHKLPVLAIADLIAPSLLLGLAFGRIGCLLNGCCYGGLCDTPSLGLRFPTTSPVYERQLAQGELHGFRLAEDAPAGRPRIAAVLPGTPAEAAGLRTGMTVLAINGYPAKTVAQAGRALLEANPTVVIETDQGHFAIFLTALPPRSLPVHATQIYASINAALMCLLLWSYYPFRRRDGEVFAAMLLLYPFTRILLEAIRVDEGGKFGTGLTISQIISLALIAASIAMWAYILRQPAGSVLPPKHLAAE
jgi:phosphatidylglycerol---prolipoprotein diacylglyceryl transferase